MSIDETTTVVKHVITEHNNLVTYTDGRQGFAAFTYCARFFDRSTMEGAYSYGGWYNRINGVCPECRHVANCEQRPGCHECSRILSAGQPKSKEADGVQ